MQAMDEIVSVLEKYKIGDCHIVIRGENNRVASHGQGKPEALLWLISENLKKHMGIFLDITDDLQISKECSEMIMSVALANTINEKDTKNV